MSVSSTSNAMTVSEMSVLSCASSPSRLLTAPSDTKVGYSSGLAATAKSFLISSSSSSSEAMYLAGSSACFTRRRVFLDTFFSNSSTSRFKDESVSS